MQKWADKTNIPGLIAYPGGMFGTGDKTRYHKQIRSGTAFNLKDPAMKIRVDEHSIFICNSDVEKWSEKESFIICKALKSMLCDIVDPFGAEINFPTRAYIRGLFKTIQIR